MSEPDQPLSPQAPPRHGVTTWRLVTGVVVLPLLAMGLVSAFAVSSRDNLPDPMATHFTLGGTANGAMSVGVFATTVGFMAVLMWALGAVSVIFGRNSSVRFRSERVAMAWCTGVTWFLATTIGLTIGANVDKPSWAVAHLSGAAIIVAIVLGALGALVAWSTAGPPPEFPVRAEPSVHPEPASEPLGLGPGEEPMWHGHLTSAWMALLALVILVSGSVAYFANPVVGVILVISAFVVAPLSSVSTVVDPSGLDVRFGPLGWPRKHIALDTITSVRSTDDIEPLQWGGWGYRVAPGRSAVVLRRGPGLILELADGRSFAVTVDEPEAGAALLEAYRRRGSAGG